MCDARFRQNSRDVFKLHLGSINHIFQNGRPAFTVPQRDEAMNVIVQRAMERNVSHMTSIVYKMNISAKLSRNVKRTS